MKKLAALALGHRRVVYLATGLAVIQQDEVGVERRFGAVMPDPLPAGPALGPALGPRAGSIGSRPARPVASPSAPVPLQAAPLARSPEPRDATTSSPAT